jgi:hypothetical protein
MKRIIPRNIQCSSCQRHILDTVLSLSGASVQRSRLPIQRTIRRNLSATTWQRSEVSWRATRPDGGTFPIEDLKNEEVQEEESPAEAAAEAAADTVDRELEETDNVPWYLREQEIQPIERPLSDRQKLPDLPPDPPERLLPILEHISIELGLDDLTLLDLRALDPPPALGANMIMVIGTARSEKHLHVSADRFCRWLRTEYRLRPYADGLLGRNEIKLKQKRKARRAKLIGSVGSDSGDADDGIRTGWVCVNIGTIEEGADGWEEAVLDATTKAESENAAITGFTSLEHGTKLVVQMMTAEKREELDLESLWGGYLRRQEKRKSREAEEERMKTEGETVNTHEDS